MAHVFSFQGIGFSWIFLILPTLQDERRVATSYLDIPVDFYLPDGKKLQD